MGSFLYILGGFKLPFYVIGSMSLLVRNQFYKTVLVLK